MKYYFPDGDYVEASAPLDPLELVEALRQDAHAWVPSVGIEDFMEGFRPAWKLQAGHEVRIDSVDHFVADLLATGYLTPEAAPQG